MPTATAPGGSRSDALRNRERILDSARLLLASDGVDVSVDDITRHAGVGMGTLYRHFATKDELVDAVLEEAFDELVSLAEAGVADEDAWRGFTGFLENALARHVANRGLKDVLAGSERGRLRAQGMRARMRPLLRRMVERAHQQGSLRDDFTAQDMPLVFWTSSRVIEATAAVEGEVWRRYLSLLLDGLRATAATPLPVPPLTPEQLVRVAGRAGEA